MVDSISNQAELEKSVYETRSSLNFKHLLAPWNPWEQLKRIHQNGYSCSFLIDAVVNLEKSK